MKRTARHGAWCTGAMLVVAVAVAAGPASSSPSSTPASSSKAAWEARGDAVEARFDAYRAELSAYYDALQAALAAGAPDLQARLKAAAPAVTPYGYGILPTIEPDPVNVTPSVPRRAESKSYSWPWTEIRIGDEQKKIDADRAELERAKSLEASERRKVWEKLATSYRALHDAQRNIEEHIHYNRLWQAAIAGEKVAYDRSTLQHDLVVQRQAVIDALRALEGSRAGPEPAPPAGQGRDEAAFRSALAKVPGVDASRPRAELGATLLEREAMLGRQIHRVIDAVHPPAYVRVEHPSAHRWTVRVPVRTDIEDQRFLEEFRRSVERVWTVRDGADEFRVKVDVSGISLRELYPGCDGGGASSASPSGSSSADSAAPRCTMPKPGEHLDTKAHAARFPRTSAGLTTGAGRPFTIQGVIVLGSGKMKAHVLAHEFGHVLGFRDEYFRGHRDLGADGFQVMEIVADPGDVMGDPDAGPVRGEMMRRLVGAVASRVN